MSDLHNVYDLFCPSPPSLKDLVSMKIALILWRQEIQQHLSKDGTLRERYPREKTPLQCLTSYVPATTVQIIERYVRKLEFGIPDWLKRHSELGILKNDVLNYFMDFVCAFDGDIDFGKTARRFIACKGIGNDSKFKMACECCLVDDIRSIWPKVSSRLAANEIDFHNQPKLYYWVCLLKNQPHRIVRSNNQSSIEELILEALYENDDFEEYEWSSVEYFLNRLPSDTLMKHIMTHLFSPTRDDELIVHPNATIFFRYILLKLNEEDLKKLVNERGDELVSLSYPQHVIRVWSYIKNEMTTDGFCRLVKYVLVDQTENNSAKDDRFDWHELWISAPDRLKQAAIRDVLPGLDSSYFDRKITNVLQAIQNRRSVSFLLAMLSDTPIKDRITFWYKHWGTLIEDIRPEDLRLLFDLCFDGDENQKNQFKTDAVSQYRLKIYFLFRDLFKFGFLEELEEFLNFWFSDQSTIREIRFKLLRDYFNGSSIPLGKSSLLSKFIDNAYEDNQLAAEFKNKLLVMYNRQIIEGLKLCVDRADFRNIIEFFNTFATPDEIVVQMKKIRIVPILKSALLRPFYYHNHLKQNFDDFENFIGWLFKSCEENEDFKKTLNMDIVIQKLIREKKKYVDSSMENGVDYDWFENCFQTLATTSDSVVKKFLKWYFVTPEAVEKFEKKYVHDPMFNRLLLW